MSRLKKPTPLQSSLRKISSKSLDYTRFFTQIECRSGGTGRRARLKIWYPSGCEGSSPSSGTFPRRLTLTLDFNTHSSSNLERLSTQLNVSHNVYMKKSTTRHAAQNAKSLQKNLAPAERIRLKQLDGLHVRRQYPIGKYIADYFIPAHNMVVEIDGESHDFTLEHDLERDNY